jgi:hypothetical protein
MRRKQRKKCVLKLMKEGKTRKEANKLARELCQHQI